MVARQRGTHIEASTSCSHPGSHRPRGDPTYRDASGLQDEAGHMASRQAKADGITDALHEVRLETVPRCHLQKQDYPLLAVPVVLGYTQAVLHLIKGFHCGSRKKNSFARSSPQATMRKSPVRREGHLGNTTAAPGLEDAQARAYDIHMY